MNAPTERHVKKLFALSLNQCAFPNCLASIFGLRDEMIGEICHIKAKSSGGPRYDPQQSDEDRHNFENLILLCRNHHKIVDDDCQKYPAKWLKQIKHEHEKNGSIELSQDDARLAGKLLDSYLRIEAHGQSQVMVNSPGAIQAKNIVFKTTGKKRPSQGHPIGTIGADMDMHNYVSYLVKRFNEFRRGAQKIYREKRPYPYSAIHTQIESVFGNPTYFLHQSFFEKLVFFLKERIDETPAGMRNRKLGIRSYHTFDEHKIKSRGDE